MIQINEFIADEINEQGRLAYPNECCGVLLGRLEAGTRRIVQAIFPISNARAAQDQYNRFLIQADDMMRVENQARKNGLDVIGFYHSHPDHPAVPSAYDLEHAWPFYSYVIVAVAGGDAKEIASWILDEERSRFDLEIILKGEAPMSVTILVPTALRQFTEGASSVDVAAATVGEALAELTNQFGDLKKHLFAPENKLRNFVNVYVNDDNIRQKNGLDTLLSDNDTIMLVPSIAGGSPAASNAADSGPHELTRAEITRYSRHLILPEIGLEGQKILKRSWVLVIGSGGLGAPLAMYLAAAGIGTIGIVDFDYVDESNLQRQIIYNTRDVGRPKTASARDRIKAINPNVQVIPFSGKLTSENALNIIRDFDVVADGTDNFPTRYLVNDACVLLNKPVVYGSVFRFEGQASVFWSDQGACYRCLYPEPPPPGLVPSCGEGGVLGVLPGIVGCIQANETIKLLIGGGEPLINRLLVLNAWEMRFKELKLYKDPGCPVCGTNPTVTSLIDYEEFCGLTPAETLSPIEEITALELKQLYEVNPDVQIIDIREPHELAIGKLPNTKAIPLGQMVRRMNELNPSRDVVVVCKIGTRSAMAIHALHAAGYPGRLLNLKDGINGWANDVDHQMALY